MLSALKRLVLGDSQSNTNKDFYVRDGKCYLNGQVFPFGSHFDTGIPAYRLDDLLALDEVQHHIKNIRQGLPMGKEEFDRLLLPVIRNLAAHFHCLPASERHHHRAPLGLLCHSLQVGVFAMNSARSRYFQTGITPRQIRDNEVRWHVAAALGGMLHDAGKPLTDYVITDNKNNRWNTSEPLATWLEKNSAERYTLTWTRERNKQHEWATATAANSILTSEIVGYLQLHGRLIRQDLAELFEGRSSSSTLYTIVNNADKLSVEKDLASSQVVASDGNKAGPEFYIFDAIKSLLQKGQWKVNAPGARVLVIKDHGVFIDLANGGSSLGQEIRDLGHKGIPRDVRSISEILTDRRYLIPFATHEKRDIYNWIFKVEFENALGTVSQEFNVLKLQSGSHIFGELVPSAIKAELLSKAPSEAEEETIEAKGKAETEEKTTAKTEQNQGLENEEVPAADRPRDFAKLMSDLEQIEGEHQPDLQKPKAPETTNPEPEQEAAAQADPAAEIAKALILELQVDQDKETPLADAEPAAAADAQEVAQEDSAVAQTDSQPELAIEPAPANAAPGVQDEDTQSIPPAPASKPDMAAVASLLDGLGPGKASANKQLHVAKIQPSMDAFDLGPAAPKASPAAVPAVRASDTQLNVTPAAGPEDAGQDAATTADSPSEANKPAKPKKKKRKLSIRQEMERDGIQIEREQRREARLNAPLALTPDAIKHQRGDQVAVAAPAQTIDFDLGPPKVTERTVAPDKASLADASHIKLGPRGMPNLLKNYAEKTGATAKLEPETHNRPNLNKQHEERVGQKQKLENMTLAQQLEIYMPEVPAHAVQILVAQIQKVLDREVPLGVTLSLTKERLQFQPDVLDEDVTDLLCKSPCCDTDTSGALFLTDSVLEAVSAAVEKAQAQAQAQEDEPVRRGGKGSSKETKNVTLRDEDAPALGAQSGYVKEGEAVALFLNQMRLGYGDLIESGYRVTEDNAIVDSKSTLALITQKWTHLTPSAIRRALKVSGNPIVGPIISVRIAEQ